MGGHGGEGGFREMESSPVDSSPTSLYTKTTNITLQQNHQPHFTPTSLYTKNINIALHQKHQHRSAQKPPTSLCTKTNNITLHQNHQYHSTPKTSTSLYTKNTNSALHKNYQLHSTLPSLPVMPHAAQACSVFLSISDTSYCFVMLK